MDNTSVQAYVYTALRNSILCLQLKPGTAVSTQEIATKLSVSRTPVREAFIRLQRDGLVDIYPQKETVISRINLKRIQQERFIRESLECANIDAIIRKGGPHDFSALYRNLEEQKRVLAEEHPDGFAFFTIDNEFHRMLFALSGQELSAQVIADTNTHYTRVRLVTLGNMEIAKASILEHEMILSEIESNLAELARGHIRNHLHRLENEIDAFVKEYPDYFETGEEPSPNRMGSFIPL
ncbi:MAG: GntR family transcriptional regulator [Sphaerochaeta sp.]|jgi:DNA-binding GntR family transcriptional regulator|uniref:GntR family transcriptional regulator n=1 Tax=Sphaerochaeta sp. TaxID=1972642 RepID=UPI002FC7BC70